MIPETAPELISYLRNVGGFSVRLTAAGTISIRPKKKLTEELTRAIAQTGVSALHAALEKERRPSEGSADDTRPTLSSAIDDLRADVDERIWPVIQNVNGGGPLVDIGTDSAGRRIVRPRSNPPALFARGGAIVTITRDDDGRLFARVLDKDGLTHFLGRMIRFINEVRQGDIVVEKPVTPPEKLVRDLLAKPEPPLPILDRIVATPIVAPSGAIHDVPGYDAASRCIYAPPPGFVVRPVSRTPSRDELQAAVKMILEPFCDFPFVSDADQAHAVATIITIIARGLIGGLTPLFLFKKPSPGTGASLLVMTILLIATGDTPAMLTEAGDSAEWRKKLTSVLMEAPIVVAFDNLTGHLDNPHLSAALTSPVLKDRILGLNKTVTLPVRNAWLATANNLTMSTDFRRRTVVSEINAELERPWLRDQSAFRHPDLLVWVASHRAELVHAVLTLVTAWLAAGRPPGSVTLGMYESWARVIGGILETAGIKGFLGNLDTSYEALDIDSDEGRRFVRRLWQERRDNPTTPPDLLAIATHEEVGLPVQGKDDIGRLQSLGHWLTKHAGRYYSLGEGVTVSIVRAPGEHRARWKLVRSRHGENQSAGSAGSAGSPDRVHGGFADSDQCTSVQNKGQAGDENPQIPRFPRPELHPGADGTSLLDPGDQAQDDRDRGPGSSRKRNHPAEKAQDRLDHPHGPHHRPDGNGHVSTERSEPQEV